MVPAAAAMCICLPQKEDSRESHLRNSWQQIDICQIKQKDMVLMSTLWATEILHVLVLDCKNKHRLSGMPVISQRTNTLYA